jgi:hypothetical protein
MIDVIPKHREPSVVMSAALALLLPLGLVAIDGDKVAARPVVAAEEVRKVVSEIVQGATRNAARSRPLRGDELFDYYVRKAAVVEGVSPSAVLAALGTTVDDTGVMRKNPLARLYLAQWETDEERGRRLKVLGEPTLRGRKDWGQHFAVSALATVILGPENAERLGLAKEILDSQGGSGFSFADLAADYSGIEFAQWLVKDDPAGKKRRLVAESFRGADFLPDVSDLPEGIMAERFQREYGGLQDERFLKKAQEIRRRVRSSRGFAQ